MILQDTMLQHSTIERILNEKINAEWALKKSLDEIKEIFAQIDDEYISSRFIDVERLVERILRNLTGELPLAQSLLSSLSSLGLLWMFFLMPSKSPPQRKG